MGSFGGAGAVFQRAQGGQERFPCAPRGARSDAGAMANVAMSMKASESTRIKPKSHLGFLKYGVWSLVASSSRCTCFWIARPTVTQSDANMDIAIPRIHNLDSGFSSSPVVAVSFLKRKRGEGEYDRRHSSNPNPINIA